MTDGRKINQVRWNEKKLSSTIRNAIDFRLIERTLVFRSKVQVELYPESKALGTTLFEW